MDSDPDANFSSWDHPWDAGVALVLAAIFFSILICTMSFLGID